MATTILTPITLWKDFDESLPLNGQVLSEEQTGKIIHRTVTYCGRQTEEGRVGIFAHYFLPADGGKHPAVLLMLEADAPIDATFIGWLTDRGYAVLCPDYCGAREEGEHTKYPADIDYANYARAGRAMEYADEGAKKTSWYEWAAVARYSVKYLREQESVTKVGAIGVRTGGEILWKITPFAQLDCFISVGAGGWLAYAGRNKFSSERMSAFDEERHRFIAGIDSQSYAPYCKCPVLFLNAVNDKKYNCDRAYDTFRAVNPEVEKAILFSASADGLLGHRSLDDMFLFFDKYLKGRSVYISRPIEVTCGEDEEGNLTVTGCYDSDGEIEESGVFFTEGVVDYRSCDWVRILSSEDQDSNYHTFPLEVYESNERVLLYTFVRYSNGFSVTSKIQELRLNKRYRNMSAKSRVIYGSEEGTIGCFTPYRQSGLRVADSFVINAHDVVQLKPGYGGIMGICSDLGLITHRVGEPRFRASEGVALQLDAYSAADCKCKFTVLTDTVGRERYSCTAPVAGGGKWKSIVLEAEDFKSETGAPLPDFTGISALVLEGEGVLFNNVIWL